MLLLLFFFLAQSTVPGKGLEQSNNVQTASDPDTILSMLQSSDPRQQTWGFWKAGQQNLRAAIPLVQEAVEKWESGSNRASDRLPMDAALDALIQLKAKIPVALISAIYEKRPVQALILLSMLGPDGDSFSLRLAAKEHGLKWFSAANLLLSHHAPGFASLLLKSAKISATIVVSENGSTGWGSVGAGVSGGDGIGQNEKGYPPHANYYLTWIAGPKLQKELPEIILLSSGPRSVYYYRVLSQSGFCQYPVNEHDIHGPDPKEILQYIAELGDLRDKMPIEAQVSRSVAWKGNEALENEKANLRRELAQRYRELVQALVNGRQLSKEEAEALPEPDIQIVIHDVRTVR